MARVLGFLIRYFSNYYTLHRSDLAARERYFKRRVNDHLLNDVSSPNYIQMSKIFKTIICFFFFKKKKKKWRKKGLRGRRLCQAKIPTLFWPIKILIAFLLIIFRFYLVKHVACLQRQLVRRYIPKDQHIFMISPKGESCSGRLFLIRYV